MLKVSVDAAYGMEKVDLQLADSDSRDAPPLVAAGSAGGLLFPYHLGVAKCLELEGYLGADTPLAGSSAGCVGLANAKGRHGQGQSSES